MPKLVKDEELEQAVAALAAPEDLSDVDIGLSNDDALPFLVRERFTTAYTYKIFEARLATAKASQRANQTMRNEKEAERYGPIIEELNGLMLHCLRGIKAIDDDYPKAKKLMQEQREMLTQMALRGG